MVHDSPDAPDAPDDTKNRSPSEKLRSTPAQADERPMDSDASSRTVRVCNPQPSLTPLSSLVESPSPRVFFFFLAYSRPVCGEKKKVSRIARAMYLVGIHPDLASTAFQHARGQALLQLQRHHPYASVLYSREGKGGAMRKSTSFSTHHKTEFFS